ncbi:MAG: hypothetical protein QM800_08895 [Paludibacter sp.]
MRTSKLLLILYIMLFATTLFGQENDNNWSKWTWLIGEWTGEGQGQPGQGTGKFSFQTDLDGTILVRKAFSEYPATKDRAAFVHNDLMIIYKNESGLPNKAIYFDNENHVINYSVQMAEESIVFLSTKAPNMPVFRLTYTLIETGKVNIKFEMSVDGLNFKTYIEGKSVKQNLNTSK